MREVPFLNTLLGDDHPSTQESRHLLATTYVRLHRYEEAEPLFAKALAALRVRLGDDDWRVGEAAFGHGVVLAQLRQFERAEVRLAEAYSMIRVGPRTSQVVEAMVKMYEAWGRPVQASEWRRKLSD